MSANDLTTTQAAERLGVGASTVRLWCTQKRFKNARQLETPRGSVWMIPERDLAGFEPPERGRPVAKAKANGAGGKKGGKK
jgi:hypothetical protein